MPVFDSATVHLCSTLASASFGAMFLALWLIRGRALFYLLCGLASLTYAATLIGFTLGNIALSTMLCVGLGAYNSYLLAALRAFEGRRIVDWLVIALPIASGASYAGFAMLPDGLAAARIANSVVLGGSTLLVGLIFLRSAGSQAPRSRQIVGIIQLAYVPSYVASVALELTATTHHTDWLSLIPLLSDQVLLGVLNIALLAMPGERAENALREAALRDPLTGAWNRAGLARIERAAAHPVNVIVFDIDHFKRANDEHGHAAGDDILRSLASLAQAVLPKHAHLVRLGGDEFAALLPGTLDLPSTQRVAERLRDTARNGTRCTISVGVGRSDRGEVGLAAAFVRADRMLYDAKAAGRDRVAA